MSSTLFNHKNPSSQPSISTTIDHPSSTLTHYLSDEEADDLESIVRTIKSSKRLFFSPEKSNSILTQTTTNGLTTTTTISAMAMESTDPYMDFKSSMEEMVAEVHGQHDWEFLEELLGCYLMLNEKTNHCYIVQAFADLVLHQLSTNRSDLASDSFVTSFSSPMHLSSTSTTAETSCSSSSVAPAEVGGQ